MDFVVTTVRRGGDTVVRVEGELDIATVAQLRGAVETVLAERPPLLVLDLTPARFIDSTGCRELVVTAKTADAQGVPVAVSISPDNWRVRRVIDFVQLAELVPVHDALPASLPDAPGS